MSEFAKCTRDLNIGHGVKTRRGIIKSEVGGSHDVGVYVVGLATKVY